jgi:hypothetical protein
LEHQVTLEQALQVLQLLEQGFLLILLTQFKTEELQISFLLVETKEMVEMQRVLQQVVTQELLVMQAH